ncbi:hypothetical protein LG634_13350 [Streptomyces bambusae]|uniref:hypothetical protein n=1 Tax=Streptomyces bambusae TaxID=1550616 RepID=UPI001CFCB48D|nr:hypothetical protein [Streptomyces bambusae]MCB5165816.1 hypothetical protein [Streptomyces bambusae]
MAPVVENLTVVTVRLTVRTAHPRLADWDLATGDLLATEPVPGLADLITPNVTGPQISLGIRRALLDGVPLDAVLRLRARLGSQGDLLAEPHPAQGDFAVVQP